MEGSIYFIGLIETDENREILSVTKELLLLSDFNVVYENISGEIICYSNKNMILVLLDVISDELYSLNLSKFNFDIVVHSSLEKVDSYIINKVLSKSKICIINSDNIDLLSLVSSLEDVIIITYGYHSKATLSISSYEKDELMKVNLSLQREINPILGEKIEPFEFCLSINSLDEEKIYSLLAGATLNILIGDGILNKSIEKNIVIDSKS